jgi:hypothetical protein
MVSFHRETQKSLNEDGLGLSRSLSYGFSAGRRPPVKLLNPACSRSVRKMVTDYERLQGSSNPASADSFRMEMQ